MYGGAVSRVEGGPVAGDVVDVIDSSGKFIAWGKKKKNVYRIYSIFFLPRPIKI